MPPHLVGTHVLKNQQQLATQEFMISQGSLYTIYLIITCFYANTYINAF